MSCQSWLQGVPMLTPHVTRASMTGAGRSTRISGHRRHLTCHLQHLAFGWSVAVQPSDVQSPKTAGQQNPVIPDGQLKSREETLRKAKLTSPQDLASTFNTAVRSNERFCPSCLMVALHSRRPAGSKHLVERSSKRQYDAIQYLRALAALFVVFHHSRNPEPWLFNPIPQLDVGQSGVDIFFVISGFIMYSAARAEAPWEFIVRRAVRIVPMYWLATFFLVILNVVHDNFHRWDIKHVFYSIFFIPHYKRNTTN